MDKNPNTEKANQLTNLKLTDEMKQALKKQDAQSLMSSLSESEKTFLDSLLKDKNARNDFLSSPKVKAMLDSILNGR